jgi:hypothetical protein
VGHRSDGRQGVPVLPEGAGRLGALGQSLEGGLADQEIAQLRLGGALLGEAQLGGLEELGIAAEDVAAHAGLFVQKGDQQLVGGQIGRVHLGEQGMPGIDQVDEGDGAQGDGDGQ